MFTKLHRICNFRVLCADLVKRKYSECKKDGENSVVPLKEVHRFIVDCMTKMKTPEKNAHILADALVEADHRGFYSHGLNRLIYYVLDIKRGACDPTSEPVILKECNSSALVDGCNNLGPIIATYGMDLAMKKAENNGIAIVAVKGGNHFGTGSTYVVQAVKRNFIGLCFTNTSPLMVPTRAKEVALGTNPIAMGAPGVDGDNVVIDFATTAVSFGKIDLFMKRGQSIPTGWGLNKDGKDEVDPRKVLESRKLLPLGGHEINSGYKGFAFGLLVEVLSGILAGANWGPHIRSWTKADGNTAPKAANLGQSFVAINPKHFSECFQDTLSELLDHIRCMEPVDPKRPVMVPGDLERQNMKKVNDQGGVIYLQTQMNIVNELAKELGVTPLRFK